MTVEKSKGDGKLPQATKKVAPDGGWAWMVCLGVSLVNVSVFMPVSFIFPLYSVDFNNAALPFLLVSFFYS